MQLKPPFLKRLDQYLLTNKPVIWSSRIHFVLWYGLFFWILVSLLSFLGVGDIRQSTEVYNWVILLSVISALAFVAWMIFLLRFNVFKRYGKWSRMDSLKTFLLYFIAIFLFTSWPVLPQIFESFKANRAYTTNELVNDINSLNKNICLLERDKVDVNFKADTIVLSDIGISKRKVVSNESGYSVYSDNYYYVDTASLRSRLQEADSVLKISDSVFITYKSPVYRFVSIYNLPATADSQILTSIQLYNFALKNKPSFDANEVSKELSTLIGKYLVPNRWNTPMNDNPSYEQVIARKYNLYGVNQSLENIAEKKYWWKNGTLEIVFRIIYYISLFVALLVFIYRHTTRKTFFLSLLAATVIMILTSLMIVANNGGDYSIGWVLFYFILFSVVSLLILNATVRGTIAGIALNLAISLVPIVPLVVVVMVYMNIRKRQDRLINLGYEDYYKAYPNEDLHYLLGEIAGSVLLLLLMATIIQRLYRKWYSLPEN